MKKALILLVLVVVLVAGCEGVDVSQLSDQDLQRISEKAIVCNEPYMRFGATCCLDQNKDGICDNDERKSPEQASNEEVAVEVIPERGEGQIPEVREEGQIPEVRDEYFTVSIPAEPEMPADMKICGSSVSLFVLGGETPRVCLFDDIDGTYVLATLANNGTKDIEELAVRIHGTEGELQFMPLQDSQIRSGFAEQLKMPYDSTLYGNIEWIDFIPVVEEPEGKVWCSGANMPKIQADDILNC